jgi:hypothetical protein
VVSNNDLVLEGFVDNVLSLLELLLSILSCNFANDVGLGTLKNGLGCLESMRSLVLNSIRSLKCLFFQSLFIFIVDLINYFNCFFSNFLSCNHSSGLNYILGLVDGFLNVKLLLLGLCNFFYLLGLILGVVLSQHLLEWLVKVVFFGCFGLRFGFGFSLNFSFNFSFNLGLNLCLNFDTIN